MIWPWFAAFSIAAVSVAAGPATSSSRWRSPTRNRCTVPLWIPTDIFRSSRPAAEGSPDAARRAARISTAAEHACTAWSSLRNIRSSASPPNFRSAPTTLVGQCEHAAEHRAQDLGQHLGPDAASAGELLREPGETGDVDEDQRGVDRLPRPIRRVQLPLEGDARQVALHRRTGCRLLPHSCWPSATRTRSGRCSAGRVDELRLELQLDLVAQHRDQARSCRTRCG